MLCTSAYVVSNIIDCTRYGTLSKLLCTSAYVVSNIIDCTRYGTLSKLLYTSAYVVSNIIDCTRYGTLSKLLCTSAYVVSNIIDCTRYGTLSKLLCTSAYVVSNIIDCTRYGTLSKLLCTSAYVVSNIIDCTRYGTLSKLLCTSAYVVRFVRNVKERIKKDGNMMIGPLMIEELEYVEQLWITYKQSIISQSSNYLKLKNSLKLLIDDKGIIRSHARISGVKDIDFKRHYPILLRSVSFFTKLIVSRAHAKVCHQGVDCTLNQISGEYWIIRGRQVVKKILRKCAPCRVIHGKTALSPSISNLPSFRIICNYAFENVGVDYAGPIYVSDNFSASKEMHKSYILLFTCATSRGVHLELTPSTNAISLVMSFLNLLRENYVLWKFILEKSPWCCGFYER